MGQSTWDAYLLSPEDFAGADDIITNLEKEREPGIEILERTLYSLIITSLILTVGESLQRLRILKLALLTE